MTALPGNLRHQLVPLPELSHNPLHGFWMHVAGPLVGAVLAVAAAWVLRGAGGGRAGSGAAKGDLYTEVEHPDKVVMP
jgi:aquaporin Z